MRLEICIDIHIQACGDVATLRHSVYTTYRNTVTRLDATYRTASRRGPFANYLTRHSKVPD